MALRQRVKRGDSRVPFGEKDLERLDGITSRTRKISPNKSRPNAPPPPPPVNLAEDEEEKSHTKTQYREEDRTKVKDKEKVHIKTKDKVENKVAPINIHDMHNVDISNTHMKVQKTEKLVANEQPVHTNLPKSNADIKSKKPLHTVQTKVHDADKPDIKQQPSLNSPLKVDVEVKSMQSVHFPEKNAQEKDKSYQNEQPTVSTSCKKTNVDNKSVESVCLKEKISLEKLDLCINDLTPPMAPPRKRSNNKQPQMIIIKTPSPSMHRVRIESPSVECTNKTVVQINGTPAVHKLQIKNEFSDVTNVHTVSIVESPQRKTSILINGDDCYSTVNVNDNIPLYQSSVVVKDSAVEVSPVPQSKKSSTVYITGTFILNETESPKCDPDQKNYTNGFDFTIANKKIDNEVTKDYVKVNSSNNHEPKSEVKGSVVEDFEEKDIPSSELLKELLRDPVEAVRRNLVPHVCGKSDVPRRPRDMKIFNNRVPSLMGESLLESPLEDKTSTTNSIENSFLRLRNYDTIGEDVSSEHSSSTQYELMDPGSDCYTDHSNRSSVTEEELSNRTKFYELLAESAVVEVTENDDHHYETIKVNNDPIYEEIEIPPPLPANPPPSSLLDDLNIDKEFTTR